jgi:hypothetical protein
MGFYAACAFAIALPCALLIVMAGVRAPLWVLRTELLGTKFDEFQTPEAALGSRGKAQPDDVATMRGVDSGVEALFSDDTTVTLLKLATSQGGMSSVERYLSSLSSSVTLSGGSPDDARFHTAEGSVGRAVVVGRIAVVVRGQSTDRVDARLSAVPALYANDAGNWANWLLDDHRLVLGLGLVGYLIAAGFLLFRLRLA